MPKIERSFISEVEENLKEFEPEEDKSEEETEELTLEEIEELPEKAGISFFRVAFFLFFIGVAVGVGFLIVNNFGGEFIFPPTDNVTLDHPDQVFTTIESIGNYLPIVVLAVMISLVLSIVISFLNLRND